MSACALQSFNNITPESLNCLEAYAKSKGYNISGNNGSITEEGYTFKWN